MIKQLMICIVLNVAFWKGCVAMWDASHACSPPTSPGARMTWVGAYVVRAGGGVGRSRVFASIGARGGVHVHPREGTPSPIMIGDECCYGLPAIELTDDGPSPTHVLGVHRGGKMVIPFFPRPSSSGEMSAATVDGEPVVGRDDDDGQTVQEDTVEAELPECELGEEGKRTVPLFSWLLSCPNCWRNIGVPDRSVGSCSRCACCRGGEEVDIEWRDGCQFCCGRPGTLSTCDGSPVPAWFDDDLVHEKCLASGLSDAMSAASSSPRSNPAVRHDTPSPRTVQLRAEAEPFYPQSHGV